MSSLGPIRRVLNVTLVVVGAIVWLIGLAGLPDDVEQWASWLPTDLLSNPGFYGPVGVMTMYVVYDRFFRERVMRPETLEAWRVAHSEAVVNAGKFYRHIFSPRFLIEAIYVLGPPVLLIAMLGGLFGWLVSLLVSR